MERNKFYIVYKITNLFNNRYYIGSHVTYDLNDGYMGSGRDIKRLVKKYGKESFRKEILEFCENENFLSLAEEKHTLTKDEDPMSYNIVKGRRPPKATSESCRKSYQTKKQNGNGIDGDKNPSRRFGPWNKGIKTGPNPEHSKRMKGKKWSEKDKINRLNGIKEYHKNNLSKLKGKTWFINEFGKREWKNIK